MMTHDPDLSVIIPALNEAENLPRLLRDLGQQEGVRPDVVVVDGGSSDDTPVVAEGAAREAALGSFRLVPSEGGRGRQMNAGARVAGTPRLLFLHADSVLRDRQLLGRGLSAFDRACRKAGHDRVAGHFGLRFLRSDPKPSAAYYFYEAKTRLNREDAINGDQGCLLSTRYFRELGGFDESLPFMEDARLARRIFAGGAWITLPGAVWSSARRFETEGLKERQILNALLCHFDHVGYDRFFRVAGDAYRQQDRSGRLQLEPFFRLIHKLRLEPGVRPWVRDSYATGRYVAANAWQLAFALDCAANRRRGLPPGAGPTPWLDRYERALRPLVTSRFGNAVTGVLTLVWFYATWLQLPRPPLGGKGTDELEA